MKQLLLINGTMGVGKTTVCRLLSEQLTPSVFLDGDWCWDLHPFQVTEEGKAMVMNNITHLLRSFLNYSGVDYVIFGWVIPQPEIFNQILTPLSDLSFEAHKITLICSPEALRERLELDIKAGTRTADVITRSLDRLPLYQQMDTEKLDVSSISAREAAEKLRQRFQLYQG